jgi:hypothetical protein
MAECTSTSLPNNEFAVTCKTDQQLEAEANQADQAREDRMHRAFSSNGTQGRVVTVPTNAKPLVSRDDPTWIGRPEQYISAWDPQEEQDRAEWADDMSLRLDDPIYSGARGIGMTKEHAKGVSVMINTFGKPTDKAWSMKGKMSTKSPLPSSPYE